MVRAAFLALAAFAGAAAQSAAQAPLSVRAEEGSPAVVVGSVLDDGALADAVRSGLPLRMRFQVELWKDSWFDDLVQQASWTSVLGFEPLEQQYLAVAPGTDSVARFATYADARKVLEQPYTPPIRPVEAQVVRQN